MRNFLALSLPALAMAAAIAKPRQVATPFVKVLSARSLSNGPGSGCPSDKFSVALNEPANILTIIFDVYDVSLGPGTDPNERENFCDFEVTFNFPVGCTQGIITTRPGGTIRLENRFDASFASAYTITSGQLTGQPGELRFTSANYGAPVGSWLDFTRDHPTPVKVTVNTENERNVLYTARTRIFLVSPGITATEQSIFFVDHADILIGNLTKC
ncbi:hypothetical protein B0H67DRAFT_638780 [Lasiosphaeris hirsuta]|uniref:Ubiquitin 3 binding protein But2 C-terminal domain-containing protein n=1 Tax=Lasiosphaeris hirsuta TaxID=260670 RepID=A0AA40B9N2_9PEZI|nr:hypothetical protein B0H67DRAFT_638780 [Lasiosphaeris hirsuta]